MMPTLISQKWQGSRIVAADSSKIESDYTITGTSDEFVAVADLNTATLLNFGGLIKESVEITKRLGETAWLGRVRWAQKEPNEAGDSTFSFDTGGGTIHKSQAINTLSRTPAPGLTAPDFQGAIGVTDTAVEGVDVQAPTYTFSETHFLDVSVITAGYKQTLFALTGGMNNAAYKGFSAGECIFKGAAGTLKDYQTWEITYNFAASPNASSFSVGPITVPLKRGWDYLWVRYREVEDSAAGHLCRRPIAAYVEQVSPLVNLTLLGI